MVAETVQKARQVPQVPVVDAQDHSQNLGHHQFDGLVEGDPRQKLAGPLAVLLAADQRHEFGHEFDDVGVPQRPGDKHRLGDTTALAKAGADEVPQGPPADTGRTPLRLAQ